MLFFLACYDSLLITKWGSAMNDGFEVRNMREVTTGDFVDFEVLHAGVWKDAQISRSALAMLSDDPERTDLQIFDANKPAIARVAQRCAETTPDREKIRVSSDDVQ